jgi:Tfp pilus assembly protein PilE
LIVIVVIGILAAITIVAYNGVQQRATASASQSAASQAAKKLLAYAVDNSDSYPTTLAIAGVNDINGGTTFQYTVNNGVSPKTFCVTATTSTASYWVSNSSTTPTAGGCAGHGVGGIPAITNLLINSSFTASTAGWQSSAGTGGTASFVRSPTGGVDGGPFGRMSWTVAPTSFFYATTGSGTSGDVNRTAVTGGVTYTASGWVRASWAVNIYPITTCYDAAATNTGGCVNGSTVTLVPNTWTRLNVTFTPGTGTVGAVVRFQMSGTPFPSVGSTFDIDQVMVTQGSTLYNYADGDSSSWVWNGTANASTSTGPPL